MAELGNGAFAGFALAIGSIAFVIAEDAKPL
jgi:hypothetical protein